MPRIRKIRDKKTSYNRYQGNSKRIIDFLSYGRKESSTEIRMRSLTIFEKWIKVEYKTEMDDFMSKLETHNNSEIEAYKALARYAKYLVSIGNEPVTIKNRVSTARVFMSMESNPTIPINTKSLKYQHYVQLPTIIKKQKRGLDKETLTKLIQGCAPYPRLRMIIWFLAATSCRIGETLLLRMSDLHLDGIPKLGLREPFMPYISIRGETTKTGQDRTVLLTSEITEQLKLFIKNKYKERNSVTITKDGKSRTEKVKPVQHNDDYVFMHIDRKYKESDAARFVYRNLVNQLHGILENLHLNERTRNDMYAISLHKIRMSVRTRISDLGFRQSKEFADYFMGHDTSTYYQPTDDEYKKQFLLCQTELTYFDQTEIKKSYGEVTARMNKLEDTTLTDLQKQIAEFSMKEQAMNDRLERTERELEQSVKLVKMLTVLRMNETGKTTEEKMKPFEDYTKFLESLMQSNLQLVKGKKKTDK